MTLKRHPLPQPLLSTIVSLGLLACVSLSSASARAQVNVDLTYQGRLEIDAVPTTGNVSLRLGIFGSGDSATCLTDATLAPTCGAHTAELVDVPVTAGAFSAALAQVPVSALSSDVNLGVAVLTPAGDYTLLGMQPLTSVTHAAQAADGPFAPPVGSIVAWHPAATGQTVADLPANWAPCNGQVVNGFQLPNLNATGRFLRGGVTSGVNQTDSMQDHRHIDSGHSHTVNRPRHFANEPLGGSHMFNPTNAANNSFFTATSSASANIGGPTENNGGVPRVANETRPTNMSVIWIMRVQ